MKDKNCRSAQVVRLRAIASLLLGLISLLLIASSVLDPFIILNPEILLLSMTCLPVVGIAIGTGLKSSEKMATLGTTLNIIALTAAMGIVGLYFLAWM